MPPVKPISPEAAHSLLVRYARECESENLEQASADLISDLISFLLIRSGADSSTLLALLQATVSAIVDGATAEHPLTRWPSSSRRYPGLGASPTAVLPIAAMVENGRELWKLETTEDTTVAIAAGVAKLARVLPPREWNRKGARPDEAGVIVTAAHYSRDDVDGRFV